MAHYGETESEHDAKGKLQCREIVKEIVQFGVDQQQLLMIIKLLAMELEDVNMMRQIAGLISQGPEAASDIITTGDLSG